jgi:hypothetical protein
LQHGEFIIYIDQKSLSQLNEQRLHTHWQQKVFTKLLGLQYKVIYKKGADNNRVADALSRKSSHDSCSAISVSTPLWLHDVVKGYQSDQAALDLISKLSINSATIPNYTLSGIRVESGLVAILPYSRNCWLLVTRVLLGAILEYL